MKGVRMNLEKITGNFEELQVGVNLTYDHLNNISAFIEQLSASTHESSESISNISNSAEKIREISNELVMLSKLGKMRSDEGIESALLLKEKASSIKSIILILIKLANMINFLSINLRIKTAHRGLEGTEFTYISESIVALHEEIKQEVKHVAKIIKEMEELIHNVANKTKIVNDSFSDIENQIDENNQHTIEIATALQEQSAIVSQTSNGVNNALTSILGVKEMFEGVNQFNNEIVEEIRRGEYENN